MEMARRVCFNFNICLRPFWPFTLWLAAASATLCHPKLRYTHTHSSALDSFGNYLFHFANRMAEHAQPARSQLRDACRLWYGFKWDALELKYIHFYYLSLITHTQRQRQRQKKIVGFTIWMRHLQPHALPQKRLFNPISHSFSSLNA